MNGTASVRSNFKLSVIPLFLGAQLRVGQSLLNVPMQNTAEHQLVQLTGQGRLSKEPDVKPLPDADLGHGEKDQAKALENWRRNHMLKTMARVSEASLPLFRAFK